MDKLDADGFGLLSNYNGVYLSDPKMDPSSRSSTAERQWCSSIRRFRRVGEPYRRSARTRYGIPVDSSRWAQSMVQNVCDPTLITHSPRSASEISRSLRRSVEYSVGLREKRNVVLTIAGPHSPALLRKFLDRLWSNGGEEVHEVAVRVAKQEGTIPPRHRCRLLDQRGQLIL